ncbi:hypothetical protein B0H14DRAFT_2651411 [Mycena olivaceomarginata]|nr:hypothetical protein B0H14DRAFT_2651411 [Mycena olivaceomarginata]
MKLQDRVCNHLVALRPSPLRLVAHRALRSGVLANCKLAERRPFAPDSEWSQSGACDITLTLAFALFPTSSTISLLRRNHSRAASPSTTPTCLVFSLSSQKPYSLHAGRTDRNTVAPLYSTFELWSARSLSPSALWNLHQNRTTHAALTASTPSYSKLDTAGNADHIVTLEVLCSALLQGPNGYHGRRVTARYNHPPAIKQLDDNSSDSLMDFDNDNQPQDVRQW